MNPQKPTVSFSAPVCTCIIIKKGLVFFCLFRFLFFQITNLQLLVLWASQNCILFSLFSGWSPPPLFITCWWQNDWFLLGFSLVFLTKSWIYSSNYYYFFSESSDFSALMWFRDLRWDSSHLLLEEYASAHRLKHLFLFFLCVCVQVSPGKVFDLAR